MPRFQSTVFGAASAVAAMLAAPALQAATQLLPVIPTNGISVTLNPIATGLVSPIDLRADPTNGSRQFITDQAGKVTLMQNGIVQSTPFIDVSSRLAPFRTSGGNVTYDERGLLGFAVDPDFTTVGAAGFHKVYTYTSEPTASGTADYISPAGGTTDHHEVIAEWTVDPNNINVVDPNSRREILRVAGPNFNHDGGPFVFGPDKKLYISFGDGGASNDTGNGHVVTTGNAQTTTAGNLLGKILRIDPHGTNSANGKYGIPSDNPFFSTAGAATEIYAYGLRNVYRMSFDRGGTHDLIAADVGQNDVEEIDRITSGANFGWHNKEGTFTFSTVTGHPTANSPGSPSGFVDPLAEYDHTQGQAIVGGFVYRGSLLPQLAGKYVFGEYAGPNGTAGRLFYADLATGQITEFSGGLKLLPNTFVKGMGEDANGELYVTTASNLGPDGTTGVVYEIVPEPTVISLLASGAMLLLRPRRRRMG